MSPEPFLQFGPYRLMPGRRVLLEGERPVRLGSRAFDILVMLAERAGDLVSAGELMAGVWGDTVVDAGSLRVHVAALRKVLGDGASGQRYISNVPLKGYCFVATVTRGVGTPAAPPPAPRAVAVSALPALLTRLVGRDDVLADLPARLPRHGCVTVVGPGGIGKTSLALAVAHAAAPSFGHGALFVELGTLQDGRGVPAALASALGLAAVPADPVRGITAFLRDKPMLIVLDNCEHLIDDVAALAEAVIAGARGVRLLVTSREPLRIQGEWVQRLNSLPWPEAAGSPTARDALAYPAVQLFVERATASQDTFQLHDSDVPAVVALCGRLDGIPLAIELAAATVETLGLTHLANTLSDQLSDLMRGRRTALPRHQTLRATLDWSHALLSDAERALLRRLSVFGGAFGFECAEAVGGGEGVDAAESLSSLVSKSLVSADISGDVVQYRLLEMTRRYAAEHLTAGDDGPTALRRLALHLRDVFARAEGGREPQPPVWWQVRHASRLADLRTALAWAWSPAGDVAVGIALAATSAPLWFALSLMAEYRTLAERTLDAVARATHPVPPDHAMKVHEAYGHALWHTRGSGPAMADTFERALGIAERLGEVTYQQRALWGLWLICNTSGDYAGSVRLAERFGAIDGAADLAGAGLTHDRMMALGLHFHGEQGRARYHAQRVLDHQATINHAARNSGFQFDQRVAALTALARILWVHGFPEQSLAHAERAVEEALANGHALSLCYAIANGAAPAAFWAGDRVAAERYTRLLLARSTEHSLVFWQAFGEGYELLLAPFDAERGRGATLSLAMLTNPATSALLLETVCTVDDTLADERILARADAGGSGWCAAELLRIKGVSHLRAGGDSATAVALFERGIAIARLQQALSWELRCTESLVRLRLDEGEGAAALAPLAAVVERFTEGRESADLQRVRALLDGQAVR